MSLGKCPNCKVDRKSGGMVINPKLKKSFYTFPLDYVCQRVCEKKLIK